MTREEALEELKKPKYPKGKKDEDTEYVMKKFGMEASELEKIMDQESKTFLDYPNNYGFLLKLRSLLNYLRSKKIYYN